MHANVGDEIVALAQISRKQSAKRANKFEKGVCLRVGAGADVDSEGFAAALELVGHGDVVAEEAVARHLAAHHAGQDGARVQPDAHLQQKKESGTRFSVPTSCEQSGKVFCSSRVFDEFV